MGICILYHSHPVLTYEYYTNIISHCKYSYSQSEQDQLMECCPSWGLNTGPSPNCITHVVNVLLLSYSPNSTQNGYYNMSGSVVYMTYQDVSTMTYTCVVCDLSGCGLWPFNVCGLWLFRMWGIWLFRVCELWHFKVCEKWSIRVNGLWPFSVCGLWPPCQCVCVCGLWPVSVWTVNI